MTIMTAWTFSSCSEELLEDGSGSSNSKFEVILPNSGLSTRTSYEQDPYGKLKSCWNSDDKINVYGSVSKTTHVFSNPELHGANDSIARWNSLNTAYQNEENLVAVYPALPINNDGIVEMDFSNQDGTLAGLKNYDLMVSNRVPYNKYEVKFNMVRKNVFLRISVSESDLFDHSGDVSITLTGSNGINKVSYNTQNQVWNLTGENEIVVNCSNSIAPNNGVYDYYVAVPAKQGQVIVNNITLKKGNDVIKSIGYDGKLDFVPGHIYSTELKNEITTAYLAHGSVGKGIVGYNGPYVNSAIISQVKDQNPDNLRRITFVANSKMQSNVDIRYPDRTGAINPSPRTGIFVIPQNDSTEILICTPADKIITSNVPAGMFKGFKNLEYIDNLSMLCTDGATLLAGVTSSEDSRTRDMSEMFMNCHSLKSLDLSSFATQTVIIFTSMFEGCTSLTSLDISSFHTKDNYSLTIASILTPTYGLIESKRMNNMFKNCNKLEEINFGVNFDITKFYYSGIFRAGLEGITGTFSGTPDSMRIITNKDTRDQLTYTQPWPAINVPNTMGLTGKTIKWINAETGQPLP